ncbi:MAG: hypothetical protein LBN02_03225 [Oscillospiraceae bacterium]|jgi:AAA+ ATPase superfamily predicted ATPase|nr:hypothetical protein [Oscillospiraceae bacterium]
MVTTGYHGTSAAEADAILSTRVFKKSASSKEWLGEGIYFYDEYIDAYKWAKDRYGANGAVLHVIIEVDDDEYLDLLDKRTAVYLAEAIDVLEEAGQFTNDPEKNICTLANFLWQVPLESKEVKLLLCGFYKEKKKVPLLIDVRDLRHEMCVRDNEYIKSIQKVEAGDQSV